MARRPSLNKKNMEAIRKICTEDLTMGCGYVFNINTADQWYPVYYHEDTLIVVADPRNSVRGNENFNESYLIDTVEHALIIDVSIADNQSMIIHCDDHEKPLSRIIMESIQAENLRFG